MACKNAQFVSILLISLIFQGLAGFLKSYPQTYPQKLWVAFLLMFILFRGSHIGNRV